MGYTHYWENRRFTAAEWSRVESDAQAVLGRAERRGTRLAGPDGAGAPWVNDLKIAFNGPGDQGCEPFVLSRLESRGFCKTGRLPYDAAVVAMLLVASRSGALTWSSDGTEAELEAGRELVEGIG